MKNIKKTTLTAFAFMAFATLFFFSCKKLELDKVSTKGTWNPNMAVPLAFGEFGVYDILARTDSTDLIVIDPEIGSIALLYNGDLFSFKARDFYELEDFTESEEVDLAIPVQGSYGGNESVSETSDFLINTPFGSEIHEVTFREGNLNVTVSSTYDHNISVDITFPGFIKDGSPIQVSMNLAPAGNGTETVVRNVDLTDVIADLTKNGTTVNEFAVDKEVEITGTGSSIDGDETVTIDYQMVNQDYDLITGYFGQPTFETQDSILLKIFQNVTDGYFQFTNPKFRLEVDNSLGIPLSYNMNELKTIIIETSEELHLIGNPTSFPVDKPSSIGLTQQTIIELNKTNTDNIETIVTPTPQYFYFDTELVANPDGQTGDLNFLTHESSLDVSGEIELPLEGFAYGFEFRETYDFEINQDLSETDRIEFVMLRLIIDNGFPVDLAAQVIFKDENQQPLFTSFESTIEPIFTSGQVDSDGRVVSSTREISDIVLEREQIDLLDQVRFFEVIGFGETRNGTDEEIVKVFDDYKVGTQLSIQIEVSQDY